MQRIEHGNRQRHSRPFAVQTMLQAIPRVSVERVGETLLLLITGAFFVYLLLASLNWPLGAALMPRLVASAGLIFLALRVVQVVRLPAGEPGRIMDTGFASTEPGSEPMKRFATVFGSLIGLCFAIWLVGWHLALPAYVVLYLRLAGGVRWWAALLVGAAFLTLLVGVYDIVFQTPWTEPAILRLIE